MGTTAWGEWEPDCDSCSYQGTGIDCEVRTMGDTSMPFDV